MKRLFKYMIPVMICCISCQDMFINDETGTRQVSLTDFNAVVIKGIYNIILVQDSANKLVITGKNNISSVQAKISNDTLVIDNKGSFSPGLSRNTLELHFSKLNSVYTDQPINITAKNTIKADLLSFATVGEVVEADIKVDCNYLIVFGGYNTLGKLRVTGKTYFADLSARYGTSIDAGGLSCTEAMVYNSSVGDIYVNASRKIGLQIKGTGNIYFYGNPVISIIENTGKGKLVQLN